MLKRNKRFRRSIQLLILVVSFASILSSCGVLARLEPEYWQEQTISSKAGYYTIDPDTILDSLFQGNTNVFTLYAGTPEAGVITYTGPVQWSQADYFQIAQALHELVWEESWQDWKINLLFFRLDCEHANEGPQIFSIKLYKINLIEDEGSRIIHVIDIKPLENFVSWDGYEKKPLRESWNSIDLAQINVPVEFALKIAEESGGFEVRSAIGNQCVIFIQMVAPSLDNGWQINYVPFISNDRIFSIYIDPITGQIK